MAIAGPTPTPIIVEPAPSVQVPSPASLATSSLDPNSSSDSYNSSRPQSQYSSDTSQSELPSPLDGQCRTPETGTSPNDIELSSLAPPVLGPPSPSLTPPVSHATSENGPPRSVPPHPFPTETIDGSQEFGINNGGTSLATLRAKIHERRWLENTIGVLGVAVAIWLGVRGYKLAVWQSWNDLRQTCAAYKQSNVKLGPRCSKILQGDPPGPPYWLRKWAVDASNSTATRMVRRGITKLYRDCSKREFDVPPRNYSTMSASLTIISVLFLFGLWFFWRARGKSKDEEVFTSAARSDHSDLHFTRHYDDGAQTISGQGVITKQKPEDENYPGEVRRRLRTSEDRESQDTNSVSETSWASHNTSADTLVAPWQGSRRASTVSLRDRSKNEKHEGLIELDVAGKRKAFFKPSTGEFFHISPWKSTHSDSEDSDDDDRFGRKAEEKHSTHRALGQMVAGGVSWAVGKRVDQELAERLQRKVDNRKHRQPPQRAGDCLAGEVTNEWPTGKPTIV